MGTVRLSGHSCLITRKHYFDLIDHSILVRKLCALDIAPSVIKWIIDFLSARSQRIRSSDCDFPPVEIGEECIKLVKDAKLLGVTISCDLTWNAHITEVTKKALFSCSAKKSSCSTERFMPFVHYMRALRH